MEATLLVYDYANNPAYCKLIATILDPQPTSSLQYSLATSNTVSVPPDAKPTTSYIPIKRHTITQGWLVDRSTGSSANSKTFKPAQTSTRHTTRHTGGKSDPSGSGGQRDSTAGHSTPPRNLVDGPSTPFSSFTSLTSLKLGTTRMGSSHAATSSISWIGGDSRGHQHSANLADPSALRLAAVVCGSLAGVAALFVAVICVVVKCVVKQHRGRLWRRESTVSDVTMGSSSESRSEGGSSVDSMRLSRVDRSGGNSWPGLDASSIPDRCQGHVESTDAGNKVLRHQKPIFSSDECNTHHGKPRHFMEARNGKTTSSRNTDAQNVAEVRNEKTTDGTDNVTKVRKVVSPKREEVEDVIFRCVVVKKDRKIEDETKGFNSDGGGEISKISYSPLLRSGGKTYRSMLQVQKQIEEMGQHRRSLSSAVNERCDLQHPVVATSPSTMMDRHNASLEIRATPVGLHHYGTAVSCNDPPPGSPQRENRRLHSPNQRADTSNVVAETSSGPNLPIRFQFSGVNLPVPEGKRRHFHITALDQSGTNANGDAPGHLRTQRRSEIQQDSTSVKINEPHPLSQTRSQEGIMQTAGASRPGNVGYDNYGCSELNIPSREAGSSSQRNLLPEGIGSPRHCGNYNEKSTKVPLRRKHFRIYQIEPKHATNSGLRTQEELASSEEEEARRAPSGRRANNSTKVEYNEAYLEPSHGDTLSQYRFPRFYGASTSAAEPHQQLIDHHAQTSRPTTPVYDHLRASAANEVTVFNAYSSDEIDEEEKNTHKRTISGAPITTQTPANSRSESPDPRYLQSGNGSTIISDASQMALKHGIEHIRRKLLKFQQRIDNEIEEEARRSRGNSPCSFDNISQSESR